MIKKVINYIKKENMFEPDDLVVVGVSGGADSVCLLFMLLEIQRIIPIDIRVVHINHMIRSDAMQDAQYVEQLCKQNNLLFKLVEADVEEIAQKEHISTEEAGRNVRYNAFYEVLRENTDLSKKGKIAIAHNKNDCCETFLFNLLRGSSLKGLSGIRPVRDIIVRPLMCLERCEIEDYLYKNNIHFCIDSTNLEDNYTRNRIRHHILETATKEISSQAVEHISYACERINEAYEFIIEQAQTEYSSCVTQNNESIKINKQYFDTIHNTLKGYVLMLALSKAAGRSKDIEAVHIRQLQKLMEAQSGKQTDLPYGLYASREYDGIEIKKKDINKTSNEDNNINDEQIVIDRKQLEKIMSGEKVNIELDDNKILQISAINKKTLQNIPQKKYTKLFDYDKIKGNVIVRKRMQGDFLTINEQNQRKTLKSYFVDKKIPREERSCIWLVAEKSHILWIIGDRISNYYKIDNNTKNILSFNIIKK